MGDPLDNKNAAYSEDQKSILKAKYITYITQGNFPSYFPDATPEIVETWFVSDTEKEELKSAKRIYKGFWFNQLKNAATGINTNIVPAVLIYTTKNILKDEGFDDKNKTDVTLDLNIADELSKARKRADEPI